MTGSLKAMAGSTSSPESSFIQLRKPASNEMKSLRVRKVPSVTAGSGASSSAKSASNVEAAFIKTADLIYENINAGVYDPSREGNGVKLGNMKKAGAADKKDGSTGCC